MDRETQAFLDLLSDSVGSTKILLLVNYRPEYEHRWTRKTYYNQVRLDPLEEKEAEGLLEVLVGNAEELMPLKHLILEKTEGNPFFLEEVVQTLVESQALTGEPGNYRIAQRASRLEIPPTVQVALAARLDRLPEADKRLLQASSVIGRKFSLSLLKRVADEPEEALYQSLSRLQVPEFLYEQPALAEVEYTFKHALTQEVAYNSVLTKRREFLHDKTARAIEEHYREQLEERYADLAYHYRCSGNADKAIDYLGLAGKQAVERSAHQEGINYLTAAIEQIQALPETSERKRRELRLQIALGTPVATIKGPGAHELESVYTRAQVLCEQVGDRSQLFALLYGWWRFRLLTETQRAIDIAEQMMTLAEKANEPGLLVEAHRTLGTTLFNPGEHTRSRPCFERAIQLYDLTKHRSHALLYGIDPKAHSLALLADTLWLTGYPDQALRRVEEAIECARAVGHPYSMVFALGHGTAPRLWCGDFYGARAATDEMMAIADEYGVRHWLAWGRILRGYILAHENVQNGVEEMREGLDASRDTGNTLFRPYYLSFLSQAYRRTSQTLASQRILAEALEVVNRTGERWYEAELHRLTGMLSLESDIHGSQDRRETSKSMSSFRRALDVAHQQNARSLELRAAMGVSRLLHQQGKTDEARQVLFEIYSWFTEGFDTVDLKEAKALLDELS